MSKRTNSHEDGRSRQPQGRHREDDDDEGAAVVACDPAKVGPIRAKAAEMGARLCLIDTPPASGAAMSAAIAIAIAAADAVLVVSRPSALDLARLPDALAAIRAAGRPQSCSTPARQRAPRRTRRRPTSRSNASPSAARSTASPRTRPVPSPPSSPPSKGRSKCPKQQNSKSPCRRRSLKWRAPRPQRRHRLRRHLPPAPTSVTTSSAAVASQDGALRSIHVQVAPDLHRRLKVAAAAQGVSIRDLTTRALSDWLHRHG